MSSLKRCLTRVSIAVFGILLPQSGLAIIEIGAEEFATDGDWAISVTADPGIDEFPVHGLNSWINTDNFADSMYQQWFWFRTGDSGPEQRLDSLGYQGNSAVQPNEISLTYGDGSQAITVNVDYTLTANSSTSSTITESITITSNDYGSQDVSFFAYTDLDLNAGPVDQAVIPHSPQSLEQIDFDGTSATVSVTQGGADGIRWEVSTFADQLARLEDGAADTLANADLTGGGALDYTHAFQWDYLALNMGEQVTIDITKEVTIGSQSSPFDPALPDSGGDGVPFEFAIDVTPETLWWLDPDVAVGYDYTTSGPNFASVTVPGSAVGIPDIGDGLFSIHLFDTGLGDFDPNPIAILDGSLVGGNSFDFTSVVAGGVDRFRILGIETSAALDPNDPNVFQTGLGFVGSGMATVQMDPITQFVPGVPVPPTVLLFTVGLLGLSRMRKARAGILPTS